VSYIRRENRHGGTVKTSELTAEAHPEPETGDERIAVLYELIATLGAIDRAVILLWLEDKSYAEIAEITGLTAANVGVRLSRIKNRLKSNERWNSRK
jgi:RNA polymerase sigma-70 factor (ECF subfamily)